jgi:hypothetical protein
MLLWIAAEGVVTNKINEFLSNYSEIESEEIWSVMSTPIEPSYSNIEEDKFNDLVNLAKNSGIESKDFIKAVKLFSEEYIYGFLLNTVVQIYLMWRVLFLELKMS